MTLSLYNTMGRRLQEFVPIEPGKVGLYTCGPTVWNFAHIGNLRTYVFEDILRRTLEYAGYGVRHVMNVTDVGHLTDDADEGEDKMLKGARETGRSVWDIAKHYTTAFFDDIDRLNIRRPHVSCLATEHIDSMIALIERLDAKGYVYQAGGNVYFDTSKFEGYGRLALLDRQVLRAGARVAVDQHKRNPADFALWFTRSKYEHHAMLWDSPWGRGYPGWHIECSAMSMEYLGDRFDIHCGGVDHIPVHHTNEIAQSEGATGRPWVNYWLHGEFLLTDKEKMAKSQGNFLTLSSLVESGFDPLDYRYFCLGGHYRSQLQFSFEALEAARRARLGLVDRVLRLREEGGEERSSELAEAGGYLNDFQGQIGTDLNTPQALASLWGAIKDPALSSADKLALVEKIDDVLGLRLLDSAAPSQELEDRYLELIRERERARAARDYPRADEIREELSRAGVAVEDTPSGTRWTRDSKLTDQTAPPETGGAERNPS